MSEATTYALAEQSSSSVKEAPDAQRCPLLVIAGAAVYAAEHQNGRLPGDVHLLLTVYLLEQGDRHEGADGCTVSASLPGSHQVNVQRRRGQLRFGCSPL